MVGYRRNKTKNPDAEYFITIVTRYRKTWFSSDDDLEFVKTAMDDIKHRYNLEYLAWAILPDHIHWLLASCDAGYSKVVFTFKKTVSSGFKMRGLLSTGDKFWQDRFWEHTIKDDDERQSYVEYIHYNPVKHHLVTSPRDWPYSSFHEYVERGIYTIDWADGENVVIRGAEYDK